MSLFSICNPLQKLIFHGLAWDDLDLSRTVCKAWEGFICERAHPLERTKFLEILKIRRLLVGNSGTFEQTVTKINFALNHCISFNSTILFFSKNNLSTLESYIGEFEQYRFFAGLNKLQVVDTVTGQSVIESLNLQNLLIRHAVPIARNTLAVPTTGGASVILQITEDRVKTLNTLIGVAKCRRGDRLIVFLKSLNKYVAYDIESLRCCGVVPGRNFDVVNSRYSITKWEKGICELAGSRKAIIVLRAYNLANIKIAERSFYTDPYDKLEYTLCGSVVVLSLKSHIGIWHLPTNRVIGRAIEGRLRQAMVTETLDTLAYLVDHRLNIMYQT